VSIARDVHDVDIIYIRDFDAGAFNEAPWSINRVMYLSYPGGTLDADYVCPVISPAYAAFITSDPECEFHADPGGVNIDTLTILNLGNATLEGDITVTAGADWLSLSTEGAYSIAPGAPDLVNFINMDATELTEDLYLGEIQVTHNDTSRASPQVYPIEFFVVNNFKCAWEVFMKTNAEGVGDGFPGVTKTSITSNTRFGDGIRGGMWRYIDSSQFIGDVTLLCAHGDQALNPDTIVFHRFGGRTPDPGQLGWRALSDIRISDTLTEYGSDSGYVRAAYDACTADSAVGVTVDWFFPQSPEHADFIIAKYTVTNMTESPLTDFYLTLWADWDITRAGHMDDECEDSFGNWGNFVPAQNLIYLYAMDTLGHVPVNQLNSVLRYSGGMSYIAGRDANGDRFELQPGAAMKGATDDNRENTGESVSELRPNSRFLYRTIAQGGVGVDVWVPPTVLDSSKDQFIWFALDQGRTLGVGDQEAYVVAMVTDTLQHHAYAMAPKTLDGGLEAVVDSAWAWADRYAFCPDHGDPSKDGPDVSVLDVVRAVNVAFRNFPPVFDGGCAYEQTDVTCSGDTGVLDVVRFVNVAFRNYDKGTQFCDPRVGPS
jgi:hypothetical protein